MFILVNRNEWQQNASCLQNGGANTYLIECQGLKEMHANYLAISKLSVNVV